MLDEIFRERLFCAGVIWLPGFIFLYSFLATERSGLHTSIIAVIQIIVITLALYNATMGPTLWRSKLFSRAEFTKPEFTVLALVFLITVQFANSKEAAEAALSFSAAYSVVSFVFANVNTKLRERTSLNVLGGVAWAFYAAMALYVWYTLLVIGRQATIQEEQSQKENNHEMRNKEYFKRRFSRKKKTGAVAEGGQQEKQNNMEKSIKSLKTEIEIVCAWNCSSSGTRSDYVSLDCSEKCNFLFHIQCWNLFLASTNIHEEKKVLQSSCKTASCTGKISHVIWFDKFGARMKTLSQKKDKKKQKQSRYGQKIFSKSSKKNDGISVSEQTEKSLSNGSGDTRGDDKPGISSHFLSTMDFQKLYTFEKTGTVNEKQSKNSEFLKFGSIGEERKAKTEISNSEIFPMKSEHFDVFVSSQELFLRSGNLSSKPPPKTSKFLPFMKQTQKLNEDFTGSKEGSSSLQYRPTVSQSSRQGEEEKDRSFSVLETAGSWLFEGQQEGLELQPLEEVELEHNLARTTAKTKSKTGNSARNADLVATDITTGADTNGDSLCPITRMILKQSSRYSAQQIECTVRELMTEVAPSRTNLTIPRFHQLVMEKLSAETDQDIFISDEEEEVEECPICTEPLNSDLRCATSSG